MTIAPKQFPERTLLFIESVLALRPQVAAFDCDGTLWAGDSGQDFFYWEIERGIIPPPVAAWAVPRYADYQAGKVGEEQMCGEMVTIHDGLREEIVAAAAEDFFAAQVEPRIFPEMLELTRRLRERHCQIWAVSSTNSWVVEAGVRRFGIPRERVLAASVQVEEARATSTLVRVPTGPLKAAALQEMCPRPLDVAFGNSIHDAAMLEMARYPFVVNPNPDLRELAVGKGWPVYDHLALATSR